MRTLENAMINLITSSGKRFYANLLLRMTREFTPPGFPFIAGVGFRGTKLNLMVNPHKFKELTLQQQVAVLEHECLHVIYEHLFKDSSEIPQVEGLSQQQVKKIDNIAKDLVINQTPGLEEVFNGYTYKDGKVKPITPLSMEQHFKIIVPLKETSKFYFNLLLKEMKNPESEFAKNMEECEMTLDDHGKFGEEGGVPDELKRQIVKQAIKDAQNAAGMGNTPAFINGMINDMLKSKVDWKKELWAFLSNSTEMIKEQSRSKRNRRYGILYPGYTQNPLLTISFIMDTSGSMSDEQLAQGWAEIKKVKASFPDYAIWFIQADADVGTFCKLENATKPEIVGRGWTAYQPAIDKAVELNSDIILYYGDMDCADTPTNPNIPTLWAVTGSQKPPVSWGKYVKVE